MKKALITGVAGQDGSYLSEFLLKKGYEVHGTIRRSSLEGVSRIDHLYKGKRKNKDFHVHYGDVTDSICMSNIISKVKPDEIYHLAAQSHVRVSFDIPGYRQNFTKLQLVSCLEKCLNHLNQNLLLFIQEVPMEQQNYTHIGQPLIIEKLMAFLVPMAFCLITRVQGEETVL